MKWRNKIKPIFFEGALNLLDSYRAIHHIHKWQTRGKKLVPNHENEALEDNKQISH